MQHVVFWSSPQSGPTFQRVPTLADAVELVQRLRNDHDVTDAEVHALTAVPLNFRTVVVVEAAGTSPAAPARALPDLPPVPAGFESFPSASAHPVDEYGAEVPPLGASVPGVVPDPVGPFRSLAAVGSATTEAAAEDGNEDDGHSTLHLVGLPSVEPDIAGASDAPAAHDFRPLEIVAQAIADAEPAEDGAEPAARSLGLFA